MVPCDGHDDRRIQCKLAQASRNPYSFDDPVLGIHEMKHICMWSIFQRPAQRDPVDKVRQYTVDRKRKRVKRARKMLIAMVDFEIVI